LVRAQQSRGDLPVKTFRIVKGLCLFLGIFVSSLSWAQRPKLKALHFPFDQLGKTPMKLVPAFNNVNFDNPVFLTAVPGTQDLLAVVELSGKIKLIKDSKNSDETHLLIDLSKQITALEEEGLLGLAFSPRFLQDGIFYVYYSPRRAKPNDRPFTVLSQFKASATSDAFEAHESSEIRLLEIPQPARNHKGGMLAFWGEDLYIGIGDGGGWNDLGVNRPYDKNSHNNGQNLNTLLGKILRIRPNGKGSYSIPADNPFINNSKFKPEIFAFGIRNPWRFSFDRLSGQLWLGDVGQDAYEEISLVNKGDNLGWSIFEGDELCPGCDSKQKLIGGVHKKPIFSYGHSLSRSVTGGYVYRGKILSDLYGKYIFSDFVAGKIWTLEFENSNSKPKLVELAQSSNVVSLGENQDGELYIVSMGQGILRLEKDSAVQAPKIPRLLSQTGLFKETINLIPQSGLTEYEVNSPLWSDGAIKRRFVALPNGQHLNFKTDTYWELPNKTVLVKHFELAKSASINQRVETRVLIKANDTWSAFTYIWNEDQRDAELSLNGASKNYQVWDSVKGETTTQTWSVPSQNQCFQCHTQNANVSLGISTPQLNKDDQLKDLNDLELLKGFDPKTISALPKMANPYDSNLGLEVRAKSYLHTQCFHCHMPGGPTPASIDLRYTSKTEDLFKAPSLGNGGIEDPWIIRPGNAEESLLYHRFLRMNPSSAMPPLGVLRVDTRGAELIKMWIESLSH
jgi:uncharacterized repeat protein (TIGR03806 family)